MSDKNPSTPPKLEIPGVSNLDRPAKDFDPWCDPYKPRTIYYDDVVKAYHIIKQRLPTTPLTKANRSADFRMNLYFKRETIHRTGSFHERSAVYALHKLSKNQRKNGIFTASLGNWATALSYHAQKMNIPVTVFVPKSCQLNSTSSCKRYGATVYVAGKNMNEARKLAIDKMKKSTSATNCYINGYDHPDVIAGAGTIALEILEQLPNVDAILVPIGGGGLIAGVAAVVKKLKPKTLVYGMQPYEKCCFYKALDNERPYPTENFIIPTAGYNAFHTARSLLDKVILVTNDCISRSLLHFVEEERFIVEPMSGTAFAVLFTEPNIVPELRNKNVVCIVTGGTVDLVTLPRSLDRAKVVESRLITMKIAVPIGRPDELENVLKILAALRCTIKYHSMEHEWTEPSDLGKTYITVVCETGGVCHVFCVKRVMAKLYPDLVEYAIDADIEPPSCYPETSCDLILKEFMNNVQEIN